MSKLLIMLLALLGCGVVSHPRSTSQAEELTVAIVSTCDAEHTVKMGTGVVVDSEHILTANHVIDCTATPVVNVQFKDGGQQMVSVLQVDRLADMAELSLTDSYPVIPAIITIPNDKELQCNFTAIPRRDESCGALAIHDSQFLMSQDVQPGNSGGPVYQEGKLIGIVIEYFSYDEHATKGPGIAQMIDQKWVK